MNCLEDSPSAPPPPPAYSHSSSDSISSDISLGFLKLEEVQQDGEGLETLGGVDLLDLYDYATAPTSMPSARRTAAKSTGASVPGPTKSIAKAPRYRSLDSDDDEDAGAVADTLNDDDRCPPAPLELAKPLAPVNPCLAMKLLVAGVAAMVMGRSSGK